MSVGTHIVGVGFGWENMKIGWVSHFLGVGVAAKIDVGVLLLGPPGVGELLFARGGKKPLLFLR